MQRGGSPPAELFLGTLSIYRNWRSRMYPTIEVAIERPLARPVKVVFRLARLATRVLQRNYSLSSCG